MGELVTGLYKLRIESVRNTGSTTDRYLAQIIEIKSKGSDSADVRWGEQVTVKFAHNNNNPESFIGGIGTFDGDNNDIQTNSGNVKLNVRNNATFSLPSDFTYQNHITEEQTMPTQNTLKEYIDLLLNNHNLIITGAPGTGKTYLARQIAMRMIFDDTPEKASLNPDALEGEDKRRFDDHFDFVQFHPSYDYTDFVEGLRPAEPDSNGTIGFELTNGLFKIFCKKALEVKKIGTPIADFDAAWQKFLEKFDENSPLNIAEKFSVQLTERDSIKDANPNYGSYTKENIYNVYRGLKGRKSGAFNGRMKKICDYLKRECNLEEYAEKKQDASGETSTNNPCYIFVIDEINRGEISKIFGELFFSIDPGYRGKKGKVKTQYANIQSADTVFDENEGPGWFYIPENVYIIGTMNDIDRSVESFDFAMRRRFVWQEVTAEESAKNMKLEEKLGRVSVEKMGSLNRAIEKTDGLGRHYQIGAAYFLKLEKYKQPDGDYDYEKFWKLHLEPLLREYVRTLPKPEEQLARLKKAYDEPASSAS
jgi:hypothetical protein